ncbi:MAG: hypothetical protein WDZ77_02435 [Candidatus Pacearchaeota archaeon]
MEGKIEIFFLAFLAFVFLFGNMVFISSIPGGISITGNAVNYNTYTKAICDSKNYCEDFIILCKDGKIDRVLSTGSSIQNSLEWEDSRSQERINKIC